MASTTFRFLKFWTARQIFFQILCSKKIFENFFWSDQKTGLTARRVHYGPFRSPRSISGPYQKMTIPLLNSPKPHPLLRNLFSRVYRFKICFNLALDRTAIIFRVSEKDLLSQMEYKHYSFWMFWKIWNKLISISQKH